MFSDDLDQLALYCASRYLKINFEKCKYKVFTKERNFLRYLFYLYNEIIETVHHIGILEIVFDSKISSSDLADHIVLGPAGPLRMIIYFSLYTSVLDCSTPIWTSFITIFIDRIKMVQKNEL